MSEEAERSLRLTQGNLNLGVDSHDGDARMQYGGGCCAGSESLVACRAVRGWRHPLGNEFPADSSSRLEADWGASPLAGDFGCQPGLEYGATRFRNETDTAGTRKMGRSVCAGLKQRAERAPAGWRCVSHRRTPPGFVDRGRKVHCQDGGDEKVRERPLVRGEIEVNGRVRYERGG
jgi:hypothetical protein